MPGDYSTHSFGGRPSRLMDECLLPAHPSGVSVSRLSQILVPSPPRRYCLSGKACTGILNRAQRRGKKLPEKLRLALEGQILASSRSGGIDGGGKGPLIQVDKSGTLSTLQDQTLFQPMKSVACAGFSSRLEARAEGIGYEEEKAPTISAGRHDAALVYAPEVGHSLKAKANCDFREDSESYVVEAVTYDARGNGDGQVCCTMTGGHQDRVTDYSSLVVGKAWGIGNGQANCAESPAEETSMTIDCMHDAQAVMVEAIPIHDKATRFQGGGSTRKGDGAGNGLGVGTPGAPCPTLSTADRHMVCADYIVRRLTPMECERLQGFPDDWTKLPIIEEMSEEDFLFFDAVRWEYARVVCKSYKTPSPEGMVKWWNKMASGDSPRYRSLGNSICLPGWKWICKRICAQYERDATLGSLFDGIGGFGLIWERLNGRGMCLWASEVEPFQIAVTRTRFRAEEIGKWL